MLDGKTEKDVAQRLRRIEGQAKGLQRMVAQQRQCIDLLQQLAAVDAAVERVRVVIFRHHARKCVPEAIRRGGPDKLREIDQLADIVDQFCK